ncbi:MAG TPA: hypothetical protein VGF50_06235, partial [Caulobacteraceae bacterium]
MRHYRIGGLLVESDLALQGAIPAPPGPPDATIRLADVPRTLEDAPVRGPQWMASGDRFLLSVPNVARFLISGGREIAIELAPGAAAGDAQVFLLGTGFGMLQLQRGRMVLHASAV